MPFIITEVVHKFTIVVCERAVVCFKAPPPSPISVLRVNFRDRIPY